MIPAATSFQLPVDDTSLTLAAALYVAAGLPPIPLYGLRADGSCTCPSGPECPPKNRGKHPVGRDWQKRATLDPEEVRDAFRDHNGNIGIALAVGGHVLIDADGELGLETARTWELPETLTQQTGNGAHYIYQLATHQDARGVTDRRVAPGLDVKVRGQFAAAPSRHASGRLYAWSRVVPPVVLPDWLYERIRKQAVSAPPAPPTPVDDAQLLARAQAYLSRVPAALSGSGGHAQTFAAARACVAWGFKGLGEAGAWSLLVEYNARCDPPWSDRELRHKLEEALKADKLPLLEDRPPSHLRSIPGGAGQRSDPESSSSEQPPSSSGGGAPPPAAGPDWRSELLWTNSKNGSEKLVSHIENVIRILQLEPLWRGRIRFDLFGARVLLSDPPWDEYQRPVDTVGYWTDQDATRLHAWLRRKFHRFNFCPTVLDCERAVDVVSRNNAFHPIRQYLDGVTWDGTPRLATWLTKYLGVLEDTYSTMVGRWWLISAVARIYDPGCKVDTVPILEGPQGLRKSTALRVLCGAEWFSDTPIDIGSKDAYEAIQGRWFNELAELDSLARTDPSRAKAFFSSAEDHYCPKWMRRPITVKRQCIFVGTVNPAADYLHDPTGARRFWPVACGRIDIDALGADRDQLWAEAVAEYRDGRTWYPETKIEHEILGESQSERSSEDSWTEKVRSYIQKVEATSISIEELLEHALKVPTKDWTRGHTTRIGITLTRGLGWVKRRCRDGDRRWYVYESPLHRSEVAL